jgi:hypothetical protein
MIKQAETFISMEINSPIKHISKMVESGVLGYNLRRNLTGTPS